MKIYYITTKHEIIDLTEDGDDEDKQDVNEEIAVDTATGDAQQNETQRQGTGKIKQRRLSSGKSSREDYLANKQVMKA